FGGRVRFRDREALGTPRGTANAARSGPAPKLILSCYAPGDIGGDAPCTGFDRETMLTIRAGENIPQGISILFLRNGEQRASVELAQMQRGKSLTVPLPREV